MAAPQIAVIGLPGLARALVTAGYDVLADSATGAAEVTAAVREAAAAGRSYVAIVAEHRGAEAPALRQWVALQLRRNVAVLVARSELLGLDEVPPGARTVELPADLDTIMGRFGAPARGAPVGTVVVEADGSVRGSVPDTNGAAPEPTPLVQPPSPFEAPKIPSAPRPAQPPPAQAPLRDLRPPVPTERGWVAPVQRSEVIPETLAGETMFRSPKSSPAATSRRTQSRRAPVVIVFSGKGGVGKTAVALGLAQRAARKGGLARVLLVDANRGQGDVRKYLRLRSGSLPSVFDAAAAGDPRRGIVGPTALNAARVETLAALGFGAVLAPDDEHADPAAVPAAAYRAVVDYARARFDLVVLDTQIIEAADTSGLVDGLVVPLLCDGAYGVALSDTSMAGVQNTLVRVNMLIASGVPRDHLMLGVNRASPVSGLDEGLMRRRCEPLAAWVGMVRMDPRIVSVFEQGSIPGDPDAPEIPAWCAMLDAVLHRATGLEVFNVRSENVAKPRRSDFWRKR